MGFFNDLFGGITKTVNTAANASNRPGGSTYNSQVPKAAAYSAPSVPQSTYDSQVPKQASYYYNPSTVPGGSTYDSQVPKQAAYPASSSSGSSGGSSNSGGGGSSGGGGGGGVSAPAPKPVPVPAPKPPPPPPAPEKEVAKAADPYQWEVLTIPDAEANGQYVAQMAALQKILDDFNNQDKMAREARLGTGVGKKIGTFNQSLQDLGWIDPDLYQGKEKGHWDERGRGSFGQSYIANEGDFAGRGAVDSGEYIKAIDNMQNDYNDRLNAMNTEQEDWTAAQDVAKQNKTDEIQGQRGTVKANTVADIAKSLGVDSDMVLTGFGKGGSRYRRRVDSAAKGADREYRATKAKSADELNKASKTRVEKERKAAQVLLDEKYQKAMEDYRKKYNL